MDQYERLKAEIPEIAKAVNEFKSEAVQQQAFRALIRALGGEAPEPVADDEVTDEQAVDGAAATTTRSRRRRKTTAKTASGNVTSKTTPRPKTTAPTLDKTLNLRPKGKQAFVDFAKAKSPDNANERNLVAVYYLEKTAGVGKVNVNQVYTAYKEAGWRLPALPRNSLQVTASTKGWLNTSDMDAITVTPSGENHVDHDLPAKTGK